MRNHEAGKSKVILILITLIVLSIMGAAGYVMAKQWWAKNQPRTSLTGMKISADVLKWSFRQLPELYAQIIALDDVIALIETELDRLKELAKTYPDQRQIVSQESERLKTKKDELTVILKEAGKVIEAIYVTFKIDAHKGQEKIGTKEFYDLGKHLAATLRANARLAQRIKSQNPETWLTKLKKMI